MCFKKTLFKNVKLDSKKSYKVIVAEGKNYFSRLLDWVIAKKNPAPKSNVIKPAK
jgi:hypothetical protein